MFPYALMLVSFVYMKIIGALQRKNPRQTSLGDASSLAELSKGTIMQACRNICAQWGFVTGKSFSEALILASSNPQYDKRLFIELQIINCSECQNKN